MELGAISHRCVFPDLYALDEDTVVVNLKTGKDVTEVILYHGDPFSRGLFGQNRWTGQPLWMQKKWELAHHAVWSARLRPEFKREQYYFALSDGKETFWLYGDGFCSQEEEAASGFRMRQYFKYAWLNSADVVKPPAWVKDTVWYQIMPDRFCRGDDRKKRYPLRKWEDGKNIHFLDHYGGDLKGITGKLPYLADLGISGIYLTPIFLSDTNHKYNTFDYGQIDPDFGSEEDLITLVNTAHSLGIRVMLDAVFNHCGTGFAPWQDVVEKGPESRYWDWFFVNKWPLPKKSRDTLDGKFYSFAFTTMMPKLNTNNPEVMDYFISHCRHWADVWGIDGIRFDVGDEISHRFLKKLRQALKADHPEIYLLGELWNDSLSWLQGDEYDATMNYPFLSSLQNFFSSSQSARELQYALNRCAAMYPEQTNAVQFNFLDTHDTMRAVTRCGSEDIFWQQLTVLMTMPGSPCIYYGTEVALEGGFDPDCRRPMPWHTMEVEDTLLRIQQCRRLIRLRRQYSQLRSPEVLWHEAQEQRLVHYSRWDSESKNLLTVYINADQKDVPLPSVGKVLLSRKYDGNTLQSGGAVIFEKER